MNTKIVQFRIIVWKITEHQLITLYEIIVLKIVTYKLSTLYKMIVLMHAHLWVNRLILLKIHHNLNKLCNLLTLLSGLLTDSKLSTQCVIILLLWCNSIVCTSTSWRRMCDIFSPQVPVCLLRIIICIDCWLCIGNLYISHHNHTLSHWWIEDYWLVTAFEGKSEHSFSFYNFSNISPS